MHPQRTPPPSWAVGCILIFILLGLMLASYLIIGFALGLAERLL